MNPPASADPAPHRRILAIVIALIIYGSLYPWQFAWRVYGRGPLWEFLHSWPAQVDRFLIWDIAVNLALYLPLGIFAYLAVNRSAFRAARIGLPLVLAAVLSSSIEILQLYDDHRTCSLCDVASNIAGTALGMGAGALYRRTLDRVMARRTAAALLRPTGALLLLTCWAGYQLFPLFPAWGRTHLRHSLAALWHARPTASETLICFAEWLAVACLLEAALRRRARAALVLLLLVLPARLMIAGRTLGWSDLAGAAAACALWYGLPSRYIHRAAPAVLAGALIAGELAPFHWQAAAQPFDWLPFVGNFQADWRNGLVVLFRKSFWYGSVIWLWRGAGARLLVTTAATAGALFLLERAQMHLPGRTPEITDSALALLMGLLLWILRDA